MDIPQGTLDLLILTILRREPLHGYGIAQRLRALTNGTFEVNPGSMFPALYALERDGKLRSEARLSDNNRKAKFYVLTPLGRKQLEREEQRWQRVVMTISSVLEGA
jgi:PadR family transcriptional regulator, regulatory protein PadR